MSPSSAPVDGEQSLFPASLISAEVTGALPDGYAIRPLARGDHARGLYECLAVLTWVGDPTPSADEFRARFDDMARADGTYYFLVVEHAGRVVGTGELVVEKKLYVSDFFFFCLFPLPFFFRSCFALFFSLSFPDYFLVQLSFFLFSPPRRH